MSTVFRQSPCRMPCGSSCLFTSLPLMFLSLIVGLLSYCIGFHHVFTYVFSCIKNVFILHLSCTYCVFIMYFPFIYYVFTVFSLCSAGALPSLQAVPEGHLVAGPPGAPGPAGKSSGGSDPRCLARVRVHEHTSTSAQTRGDVWPMSS